MQKARNHSVFLGKRAHNIIDPQNVRYLGDGYVCENLFKTQFLTNKVNNSLDYNIFLLIFTNQTTDNYEILCSDRSKLTHFERINLT